MSVLGNIIWLVFGGFVTGLGYILGGLVLCLTIIGIPFGTGQSEVLSGSRLRSRPSRIVYPGVCEGSAWRLGI